MNNLSVYSFVTNSRFSNARSSPMAEKILRVVRVDEQRGGAVTLSVPMIGFPEGFQLRKGEKVTLVEDALGNLGVRPLVRTTVVTGRRADGRTESFVVFSTDEPGAANVMATRPLP
jgi:hypothetical protein